MARKIGYAPNAVTYGEEMAKMAKGLLKDGTDKPCFWAAHGHNNKETAQAVADEHKKNGTLINPRVKGYVDGANRTRWGVVADLEEST